MTIDVAQNIPEDSSPSAASSAPEPSSCAKIKLQHNKIPSTIANLMILQK